MGVIVGEKENKMVSEAGSVRVGQPGLVITSAFVMGNEAYEESG